MSTKTEVKKVVATEKKVRKPRKTTARKRPSIKFIKRMSEYRGFTTGNEKVQLATLDIRNSLQRINNRAMSDDVNVQFTSKENTELQKLIREFVKGVDAIVIKKAN